MRLAIFTATLISLAAPAFADGELNLYSSRHYDTDERLYSDFEKQTGITINRIEAKASALAERMTAEGKNSPADVFITTDVGRIWRADQAGLLQGASSETLADSIPVHLRDPDGHWFGFSQRARMIFFAKDRVSEPPQTYEDLADPKFKGMVCARSSSNIYMQSLLASMVAHHGLDKATEWAQGLKDNLARKPQGGDTDQLRGVVSGECDIAIANSYYFARALRKDVDGLSAGIDSVGWVFPNQADRGTHVNISAAGIAAHSPNRENAVKFLEYLASGSAQSYFSSGNDEYPVVKGSDIAESVAKLGTFEADELPLVELGKHQREAQKI
ncbi:UNVERIFIED_CONTAM: hypothetical protein GTU68_029305, partial [Idotea baltica]|nr:hypothetical protein [Idotea baltica]